MADIFVSYATEDRERVKPLVAHLQSLGWSVWWDRELVAGPSFDEKIEQAIGAASCVVVAWTQASVASKWVRAEANEGLERGILVPVLLDDVRPSLVFRASHAANLVGWPERRPETELNALINGIRAIVGTSAQQNAVIDAEISARSIAVLRFVDMSPGRDQGPLCAGIAEEILNRLAQIRDLKVIARTSSFQFDPSNTSIREIGQRLGVGHVLEGSVRTAGNRVRIAAELIACEGESQRWSESYTRELVDLFSLYDEVAEAIARSLYFVVRDGRPRSTAAPTRSEEALKLVMQVQWAWWGEDPRKLFPLVERAIALDPNYAEAHHLRAELYGNLALGGSEPPEPNLLAARECVEKALLLNPNLAEAHECLGRSYTTLDLDFTLGAESRRRADRLRGYPLKYHLLCVSGYYEQAERNCRENIERDPFNQRPWGWLGQILQRLGRIDEATQAFESSVALAHNVVSSSELFFHMLDFARDVGRAEGVLAQARCPDSMLVRMRALIAHARGDGEPLQRLVESWVANRATRYVGARTIADAYYRLGDYAAYMHWFAVREREKDTLNFVPMDLRDRPDYWDVLTEWALDDPAQARARMHLVNEHRARIDRVTERMVLPRDYVD